MQTVDLTDVVLVYNDPAPGHSESRVESQTWITSRICDPLLLFHGRWHSVKAAVNANAENAEK